MAEHFPPDGLDRPTCVRLYAHIEILAERGTPQQTRAWQDSLTPAAHAFVAPLLEQAQQFMTGYQIGQRMLRTMAECAGQEPPAEQPVGLPAPFICLS